MIIDDNDEDVVDDVTRTITSVRMTHVFEWHNVP